jgi:hypothetical protein
VGGSTSSSSQEVSLTPEAQELMANELAMFSQMFLPAEMVGRQDALRGLGPAFGKTAGAQGTTKMLDLAQLATRGAGTQAGLTPDRLTQALTPMETARPEALGDMQQIFRQMAMQKNGLMDPRFAQFLRPDVQTSGSTEASAGQQAAQAASMAIAVAGLIAAIV